MAASLTMTEYDTSSYPTKNTMKVEVSFTVQYPGKYYVKFDVYRNGSSNVYKTYKGSTFTMAADSSKDNLLKTLDGLQAGTEYYVEASLWNCTYGNPGDMLPITNPVLYFTTESGRPSDWSWPTAVNKPISRGSAMNYIDDGTTVTPTPLTAAEWLAFMDRIKEFYVYDNNRAINNTYWNEAVTGVQKGKPMTAKQVNGARYLISQLPIQTSLPSKVAPRTGVTAYFINGLKNSLNSIP